ncbi:MAG: hypothetical protein K2Q10_09110, partial [Rhodospirillales bacterium]|nr:hypothetical protein [Rhodospirillales bacterium]
MAADLDPLAETLDWLLALPKFGDGIGLHRMLALCGDLLDGLDALKVTGSNGKGSVSAMSAAILRALGFDTGLYTSPHLRRFNERIVLNGAAITDDDLQASATWLRGRLAGYAADHPGDQPSAFEAFTLLALHHYARTRPAALVAEAGLGGRFDPVRVLPGRCAALTSLDLEHTDLLGKSLDLIAYDKADIVSHGGVLISAPLAGDLERRLEAYCRLRDVTLRP